MYKPGFTYWWATACVEEKKRELFHDGMVNENLNIYPNPVVVIRKTHHQNKDW